MNLRDRGSMDVMFGIIMALGILAIMTLMMFAFDAADNLNYPEPTPSATSQTR